MDTRLGFILILIGIIVLALVSQPLGLALALIGIVLLLVPMLR